MPDKRSIRTAARRARQQQDGKDERSRTIVQRLLTMPVYQRARCVLWYVDVRDEVRTRGTLDQQLGGNKQIVVPFCQGEDLGLFRLRSMDDLEAGTYGILEPRRELRAAAEHQVKTQQVELVVVPGVAFDRCGGRIGHGQGFYDRLLGRLAPTATRVALAFESQIFQNIPTEHHDVTMDWIVTESRLIQCRGASGVRAGREAW